MGWFIFAVVSLFCINFYVYLRFIAKSRRISKAIKIVMLLLLIALSFTEMVVRWDFRELLGEKIFDFYEPILHFCMVYCITLFTVSLIFDVPGLFLVKFQRKKLIHPIYQSIIVLGSLAITIWGQYEGLKIPDIKQVEIKSKLIKEPFTITLMSDLHITRNSKLERISALVDLINSQNSDIIVLPGDILDDEVKHIINLAQPLKKLHAPKGVFYTTGNHEYYMNVNDAEALIKQIGLQEIENRGVKLRDDLFVAGVPDRKQGPRFLHEFNIKDALKDAKEDQFKILLSHEPYPAHEANLTLSGHTHGGQLLPFQFIAPLYNFGMLAGLYGKQDDYVYVTRGAGSWGPKIREFAPYDITVIKLEPL